MRMLFVLHECALFVVALRYNPNHGKRFVCHGHVHGPMNFLTQE